MNASCDCCPSDTYDLLVIGGGSAAFAAAIRAHELGARVLMIYEGTVGGTCVNVGCVPSKTLLRAAEALHRAKRTPFAGIETSGRLVDFAAVMRQKDELVASLRRAKYIDVLEAYPRVAALQGRARFLAPNRVEAAGRTFEARRIVVATGSRPAVPEVPGLRDARPLTSTSAFELKKLPGSLLVLGGRYIALECAQMFVRFGSRVTILQRSSRILPLEDSDVTERLTSYLEAEGIRIVTSVALREVRRGGGTVRVSAEVAGSDAVFEAEEVLCATGRRPNTEELGLEAAGVDVDPGGHIVVDDHLATSAPGVYAAGDVIGEPAFVYTAAYEGRLAAENALGDRPAARDYNALPWVIFTDPQLAGVGLNEREARERGIAFETAKLELSDVPRALAARDTRGFVKLLKESGGDRLLGARILAPEGGEQVMEAALAIRWEIRVGELARMFHPYLTQSEAVKLCAQTFERDVKRLSCCSG